MRSQLADCFQQGRKERGLSLAELVRLIGYQNITKGSNRIGKFEERGEVHRDLLLKLADALDIEKVTIDTLIEQDRREFVRVWNEWANDPIRPHIVVRLIPAVYKRSELPDGIVSIEEAEIIAAETARKWNRRVCLTWSRRISIWFASDGNVDARTEAVPGKTNIPHLRLRGSQRSFLLENPETGQVTLRLINWPEHPISIQE